MPLALDAKDLEGLGPAQKDAVLAALFVALIADGEPSAPELARFEQTVAALPWGKEKAELQALTRATAERIAKSDGEGKLAFLRELADGIPGELREKVVLDMASIMAADQVATVVERNTIGTFVLVFGLDPQRMIEQIKTRIPLADKAHELGVKLEPADVAALDDAQRLAVLEALVTAVLADGQAGPAELKWFEAVVARLPWGMEPPVLQAEIKGVSQRIAALKQSSEIADFIVGIASRLPSPALREKVFYTVATIMFADGDVNALEKSTLGALVFAFGITSDRLEVIKEAVTGRAAAPHTRPGAS